jgi:hypothetical protein
MTESSIQLHHYVCNANKAFKNPKWFACSLLFQNLEHQICTAYGDSPDSYGSAVWTVPMQGVYQGNGAGPIIWAVISPPPPAADYEGGGFWYILSDTYRG